MKIVTWDQDTAKLELKKKLDFCRTQRKQLEYQWEECERSVFNTRARAGSPDVSISFTSEVQLGLTDVDGSDANISINYVMKDLRLIHSQLSANPPAVVPRPISSDPEDRRKADAADRIVRYAMRQYKLQEQFDMANLNCLVYGTAFMKTLWDPSKGDILEVEEDGSVLMEGDIAVEVPNSWNIYLDPDATSWDKVRYVFECFAMPWEEAFYRFPDKKDELEKWRTKEDNSKRGEAGTAKSALNPQKMDVVEVWQYWERGEPYNGMIGRFVWCLPDGTPLTDVKANPCRYLRPKTKTEKEILKDREIKGKAELPYFPITDIDVPGTCWGRSAVAYAAPIQDAVNRMDNVMMDNLQAHGVARMILPEGTEIKDDSITNSPWDVIKITGNQVPSFMAPMPMPASLPDLRDRLRGGIDDTFGVNESMFGVQSREQSGFSMQYATNQGNLIRRRLFNKYVLLVESVYKSILNIVRTHWPERRTINVLGREKAFEAIDIKGADIDGGFDLQCEYGTSLSLDPVSRRQEMMTMMPFFEKAGISTRTILSMLKLNELEGVYDKVQLAADRQRELFEEMGATGLFIPPEELQDHQNMLAFAYDYVMTSEYKYLPEEQKSLVKEHIKAREQLAAQGPSAAGPAGPGGALSQGAINGLPAGPESTASQADVTQLQSGPGNPGPSAGEPAPNRARG